LRHKLFIRRAVLRRRRPARTDPWPPSFVLGADGGQSILEMALIVAMLKPPLQVVKPRRGHHHQHRAGDNRDYVHNLSISRAMRERSRNP
jgi:hypothetical protein